MFNIIKWLPTVFCIIFLLLITIASIHYPGGSEFNTEDTVYRWNDNYICDITAPIATNRLENKYYRIAIAAMYFLSAAVAVFFMLLPYWLRITGCWKNIIRWMGMLSMIAAMLIFTDMHNVMIGIASVLALPPLMGVYYYLYKLKQKKFLNLGILILILLLINNAIYYSRGLVLFLPSLQKYTMIIVIFWLVWMNYHFNNREKISLN